MKRWEEKVAIEAPADKVFAYVSDFTRHGDWAEHGLQVSRVGDGPVIAGTKFSTTAKQFGTQREESTVTEVTSPRMFAWDSVGALGRIHHWFALQDEGASTVLTKGAEIVDPKFLAKLTMFKISKELPKALRSDLAKIKTSVESGG
jgi:uncharacterized membrane protein